jgi:hypothetical protein
MTEAIQNQPLFNALLTKAMGSVLNKNASVDYTIITLHYSRVLALAKAGNLHSSRHYLEEGDRLLAKIGTQPAEEWVRLFSLPKKAFYFYQIKDFAAAKELTIQAIRTCEVIEDKGFEFVFHARVQQKFNLAKVQISSGETDKGLVSCAECLAELCADDFAKKGTDYEELTIRNIYQIVIKTLLSLLKFSGNDKRVVAKRLKLFLGQTLSLTGLDQRSADHRYRELISFLGLYALWTGGYYSAFKRRSLEALTGYINDQSLKDVLQHYLDTLNS